MTEPLTERVQQPASDVPACVNCKFFRPPNPPEPQLLAQGIGECHRYPPTTDYVFLGIDEKVSPPEPKFSRMIHNTNVGMDNWCGEFLRKQIAHGQLPKKVGRP